MYIVHTCHSYQYVGILFLNLIGLVNDISTKGNQNQSIIIMSYEMKKY